jgi:hypothetical protein
VALRGTAEDGSSDIPPVRSKPTHENQHEEDDQNDPDDTDPAVTVAVGVAAEAAKPPSRKMTRMMTSMSPIDMIYLPLRHLTDRLRSSHSNC